MFKKIISLLCIIPVLYLSACTGEIQNKPDKLTVMATIFPCYDFARAVCGDLADTEQLIKPGTEIHSYDPTPKDIIKIQNSDVFIYIGGESDEWVDGILNSMDTKNKTVIKLMDCIDPLAEDEYDNDNDNDNDDKHDGIEFDEHIWTSPKNAAKMVRAVADKLSQADSKNAEAYNASAKEYIDKINALDEKFAEAVNSSAHKTMVVADKNPLKYFTTEYNITCYAAFNGCSTQTEVSAQTLARLIDTVKFNNIKAIYCIELSNKVIANAVSEQTGAEILTFHSCHNPSADEFSGGATYVSLMTQNLENLKKGLN